MNKNNNDKIELDNILKSVVKNSIAKHTPASQIQEVADDLSNSLKEAYVAEPKVFKQVTEFVTQKTKSAHYDLYKGYTESLTKVSAKLDSVNRPDANPRSSEYASLKKDEVYNLNATWLHELYFANCFDPHSEVYMDSKSYMRLERDFGTFEDWQKDFMACALSSGQGWAVCGYHIFLKRYVNTVISNHSQDVMLGLYPIIVVDMHEHAYYRDYLSDKKSYLVSQMKELNWNVIEERFLKAESINEVLK